MYANGRNKRAGSILVRQTKSEIVRWRSQKEGVVVARRSPESPHGVASDIFANLRCWESGSTGTPPACARLHPDAFEAWPC